MSAKLVVLYPRPTDVDEFEKRYHGKHLPLMRRLVGPEVPLPTYRVKLPSGAEPPYYRVAEIHFADLQQLYAFVTSGSQEGRQSALEVSTGGPPTFLLCESDE